jgi:hypothetical protein
MTLYISHSGKEKITKIENRSVVIRKLKRGDSVKMDRKLNWVVENYGTVLNGSVVVDT